MFGQDSQTVLFILNLIQAGVFCYYMCHPPTPSISPSVSPLFVVQLPSDLVLQFSEIKSIKGSNSQIHNDVIFPLLSIVEKCCHMTKVGFCKVCYIPRTKFFEQTKFLPKNLIFYCGDFYIS